MSDAEPLERREGAGWLRFLQTSEGGLIVGIVVVLGAILALDPHERTFFDVERSLWPMVHQVALYGVLAVGAAVVIIAGGIDLSVGSVTALASIVCAKLLTEWLPGAAALAAAARGGTTPPPSGRVLALVAAAMALTLAMGLAIGLFHALLINRLRLPPFIATLATMSGLRSLAYVLSNDRSVPIPFDLYRGPGRHTGLTLAIFAVVALGLSIMMGRTVLGRHLYALGGNEAAARLSGLPTRRLKAVAYGLSGVLAALAGILFSGRSGQGQSTMGIAYELWAITAAVVGGCSLAGGVGSIRGTVLGLVLVQVVIKGTGLVFHDVKSTQIEGLVLGTVVVLAVAFNQRLRGRT